MDRTGLFQGNLTKAFLCGICVVYAVVVLYPFLIMVLCSFKSTREIFRNPYGLPQAWRFSNYVQAWQQARFSDYFINSVLVSVVSLFGILLIASMAAYVLTRYSFPGNFFLQMFFLSGLMLPVRLAIVPLFNLLRALHLLDSLMGLVLVYIASGLPFAIFLLSNFFHTIPLEIEDAARIDGCNPFQIYHKIMLPLLRPALATQAIFSFMGIWNDFFLPLILIRTESRMTIPLGLNVFFGEFFNQWDLLFAGLTITIVPVMVLYLFMSKQFIAGLTAGAIK